MNESSSYDADVLVVGAGPVRLSLAFELGRRGDTVLVIERDPSRGPQPRAKTLNMRSLEHFRRWGIAGAVRAVASNRIFPPMWCSRRGSTTAISRPCATSVFAGTSAPTTRFSEPSE